MKQINLKEIKVVEVVIRPNEGVPLAVLFEVLDENGVVVLTKRVAVKREDMPQGGATALTTIVDKITARLITLEGI